MLLKYSSHCRVVFRHAFFGLAMVAATVIGLISPKPGNAAPAAPDETRTAQWERAGRALWELRPDFFRPLSGLAVARKKPGKGDANWPRKVTQMVDDYFRLPMGSIKCVFLKCRQLPWHFGGSFF